MEKKEHELKSLLTRQDFAVCGQNDCVLDTAKAYAYGFAHTTEGIAVISDFKDNECYIYSGKFGSELAGLPDFSSGYNSAFEDVVFSCADKDEMLERHILELRFFNYLRDIPVKHRTEYQLSCLIRFYKGRDRNPISILHTTRYLKCDHKGNVWLGICTYIPYPRCIGKWKGDIINIATGELVGADLYENSDRKLLTKRQLEILRLLAKGVPSKQIADRLNISLHTVNRHRQDILSCLKVANTAAAVEIGLRIGLL